ncbi:septum site-determining protein MinC [Blochmannia endosymbiont of Polyrhachis (Hedomyrma) turneri]|uniref:septum site-determining protein MinC n=1 Tax=Blochmannia endosymbiont of Polyrhachis (Hedomyrma) turneri TaxID=1505596 RepID=UPI00061A7AAE|nr:septum site-determining protein MinC [Blochmannia endosymbiont of Polyrhachis (Hedomyrma) turneri]AKC60003.1 septum site-determining protein MinC [Blochmannia endosymbiont of Polyrhachis (Hedomyrma) turneri]
MIAKNLIHLQISNFNLPVIHIINATSHNDIENTIKKNMQETRDFLKYTPVVINVANLTHKNNWEKLYQSILETKLYVIGACSCNDNKLKKIIIKSGLPILTENILSQHHSLYNSQKKLIKQIKNTNNNTQLIHTPIRSGQQIYARNRDLIIINDVSAGAEIIADGNIHIYGIMRGRILAGASGNTTCQIFCTQFFPELISIDGNYWIGDQIPKKFMGKSVRVSLQNNTLIIHSL